jgi:DNA ligase-1
MHQFSISRRTFSIRLLALVASSGLAVNVFAKTSAADSAANIVLLAKSAPAGIDPAGYLVSEKLDGVRALWDGKVLRFRSGRTIAAPAWFIAKLPKEPLDGELWIGRGQFDAVSGTVRKVKPVDIEWQKVNYMVFELPAGSGDFKDRALALESIVNVAAWPQLQAIEQTAIANRATLQAKLDDVVQGGGEGLVLHLASAPLVTGRSDVLLKLKPLSDAEATVIGYIAGKGKYAGMTGALAVKAANGQRFNLGTGLSDAQRKTPPVIGSKVTYTYRDVTPSGKPRFASFLRVYENL